MPCLDPQTPQDGVLANKAAGIQGFVEANMLETHFRVGVFLPYTRVAQSLSRTTSGNWVEGTNG
jgi:hypothetical protein